MLLVHVRHARTIAHRTRAVQPRVARGPSPKTASLSSPGARAADLVVLGVVGVAAIGAFVVAKNLRTSG
jgi:hypothetical protein